MTVNLHNILSSVRIRERKKQKKTLIEKLFNFKVFTKRPPDFLSKLTYDSSSFGRTFPLTRITDIADLPWGVARPYIGSLWVLRAT